VHMLSTGLTGGGDRSDRLELADAAAMFSSSGWHAFVRRELRWFRGSLHVCKGSSLWFSSFDLVVCALCLSVVLSRMCRALALA
jgi:hypothetical protein